MNLQVSGARGGSVSNWPHMLGLVLLVCSMDEDGFCWDNWLISYSVSSQQATLDMLTLGLVPTEQEGTPKAT